MYCNEFTVFRANFTDSSRTVRPLVNKLHRGVIINDDAAT